MYSYKRPLECTSALCLSLLGSSHTDVIEELSVITQYEFIDYIWHIQNIQTE